MKNKKCPSDIELMRWGIYLTDGKISDASLKRRLVAWKSGREAARLENKGLTAKDLELIEDFEATVNNQTLEGESGTSEKAAGRAEKAYVNAKLELKKHIAKLRKKRRAK